MTHLSEDVKKKRDELAEKERIYEPKYGGKDHSGYDTLMKYEVNDEREAAFCNGFDAGYAMAKEDKGKAKLEALLGEDESPPASECRLGRACFRLLPDAESCSCGFKGPAYKEKSHERNPRN